MTVHYQPESHPITSFPDPHQDTFSKTFLGFWIYLMTDCILFAALFITYAVLHPNTFGGPASNEIFSLSPVFAETMILLVSSAACGFALLSAVRQKKTGLYLWLFATFLLGGAFLLIELTEFSQLIKEGASFTRSAFLSSYFVLVGTHGLHVAIGLLWLTVMVFQLYLKGITEDTFRRLVLFNIFWHFLDLVWIFVFTFVYLMGVI